MEEAVSNLTKHLDTVSEALSVGFFFHQLLLPLLSGPWIYNDPLSDSNWIVILLYGVG